MKKPESIIKYKPLKVVKNDQIKGTKILMLQKRLEPEKKFLFFFNKWKRTKIILWKPDLDNHKNLIKHPFITKDTWTILSKDFTSYDNEGIQFKFPTDPRCKCKRLLKVLTQY